MITDQRVTELLQSLDATLSELARHCNDPQFLQKLLILAIERGILNGQQATNCAYHTMFAGYDETTITN